MYRVLLWDVLFATVILLSTYFIVEQLFKSVLIGMLIFLIPNGIFAWLVFRFSSKAAVAQVGRSFYRAESVKFILTAGLFAYSFMMLQPNSAASIFAAYGTLFVVHQLLAFKFIGSTRRQRR